MWEKELKLIDILGKLYPEFSSEYTYFIKYKNYQEDNYRKSWWVFRLCVYHLNQRIPRLEKFIEENDDWFVWDDYKDCFNIMDE